MSTTANNSPKQRWLWPNAWFVGLSLLVALAMLVIGRVFWCACGRLTLFVADTGSAHNSQHFFDWYSFSHLLHGVFFFFPLWWMSQRGWITQRWMLPIALLVESAWELLENSPIVINRYRQTASVDYAGDSIVNAVGDLAFCVAGFYLARALGWRWSLAVFVVLELVMLVAIRDNLTLNVVMLIYPFPAIRDWQMAGW